ncbi:hypothetical protein G9P44_000860 [Scheffersomyces stipitis]|nr:hypothetical protein G9P44_000860 [Scheffersomyces stipitis]
MSHSVYQTNGRPLSQQALYQQKLRQGIYTSPGAATIGVTSNASDTAALLAASSDLTVRPSYERTIAPEAHTAALAAKRETITAWSRENTDPNADAAAANARTSTLTSNYSTASSGGVGTGIPSLKGDSLYRAANQNSTSTMTSRINPERDIKRSGLATKSSSNSFDIGKINQVANKNSTKSLNSRFNPDLDFRSGLNATKHTEYLNDEEEALAANGAAASLRHGAGYTDSVSAQKRSKSFTAAAVVNSTLLSAANERANERLQSISSTPQDLKAQAQQYASALAVAQKNSDERVKNYKAGVIDLGGGLTILQSELDKMASLVVQPVLNDISSKASAKREADLQKKVAQKELETQHQLAKQEEWKEKNREKAEREAAKQQRIADNEDKKKVEEDQHAEYQQGRNDEVAGKVTETKELELKHAQEKEALLAQKQENQDRIDEEEAALIAGRKKELDDLQAEKDEILKPTLDELEEETAKLKEVTDARDELLNEVTSAEALNKEYEDKLAELTKNLEETKASIEKYTLDLEDSTKKHEETSKEVDALQHLHDEEIQKNAEEENQLDSQLEELNKTKEQHIADKKSGKQAILSEIDDKVKDEHKINKELPEHLRSEVDEEKIRDTGSLFSVEEPVVKEVPLVKEIEPEAKAPEPETKSSTIKPIPVVASAETPKRKGTLKRLSGLFKTPKPLKSKASELVSSPKKEIKKVEEKATEVDKAESKAEKAESKAENKAEDAESNAGDYEDELSLGQSGTKNAGGVFKEEI